MQSAVYDIGETSREERSPLAVPSAKKQTLRDALVSLSIANLCFLFVWGEVGSLASEPGTRYYETHAPQIGYVWALIANILLLAAVIFVAFLMRRTAGVVARWTGTAVIGFFSLYGLYDLQRTLQPYFDPLVTYSGQVVLKGLLLLGAAFALARFRLRAVKVCRNAFLVLSPLFLVMAAHFISAYTTNDLRKVERGRAAGMLAASSHSNRVIWIIFDELDNRLLFNARPARVAAKEFDSLRQQAIYAGHVRTPSNDTLRSVLSLFLGARVTQTKLDTSSVVVKTIGDAPWTDFSSQPNVFRRARSEGFNTAVTGWYHPYCRLVGSDLSECAWDESGWGNVLVERQFQTMSFIERAAYLARWQSRAIPSMREPPDILFPEGISIMRKNSIALMQYLPENADRMLQNRKLNLVFLHYPVPHPPGIWDAARGRFTITNSNYIDNLQLADNILGRVRRELQAIGDWDRSAIIVSGDHPYRTRDWLPYSDFRDPEMLQATGGKAYPYVPFLLKLPGQHQGLIYDRHFNSVLTSDLILDLLNGRLSKPEDAISWLDAHADDSQERVR